MSQYEEYETDHVADNEMAEVDNDVMYFLGRVIGDSESEDDDDEYGNLVCSNYFQLLLVIISFFQNMLIERFFTFILFGGLG